MSRIFINIPGGHPDLRVNMGNTLVYINGTSGVEKTQTSWKTASHFAGRFAGQEAPEKLKPIAQCLICSPCPTPSPADCFTCYPCPASTSGPSPESAPKPIPPPTPPKPTTTPILPPTPTPPPKPTTTPTPPPKVTPTPTPPPPGPTPTPPGPSGGGECRGGEQCKEPTPYCYEGRCVQCIVRGHCVSGFQHCDDGICKLKASPQCIF